MSCPSEMCPPHTTKPPFCAWNPRSDIFLTPSYFFWLPLLSWQLWAPTISSHTAYAYHLLHFTDCGCSKASQTHTAPHCSSEGLCFFFFFFVFLFNFSGGLSKELWVSRIVTKFAMKRWELPISLTMFKPRLLKQLLLLSISLKDHYS